MRSLLFVPGDSERKLDKAASTGADALIVDLEDSVAPANKERARGLAAAFVRGAVRNSKPRVYVRVNGLQSGFIDDDLRRLVPSAPHGIMLPKASSLADLQRLSLRLRVHEAESGLPDGSIRVLPIITETAAGLFSGQSYAFAGPRLEAVTWGAEDLSAAVGARTTRDGSGRLTDLFRQARNTVLLAAGAAEIPAIDTVFVDLRDDAGLGSECLEAERDGFSGKMAVHPDQVAIINEAFTPSRSAIEEAMALIAAFENAGNPGVVALSGRMVDLPHRKRADRLLARARAAGVLT